MSSLKLGRETLRNNLIDFFSKSKPFESYSGVLHQRYYFNKNCNESVIHSIVNKPVHQALARQKWGQNLHVVTGQKQNHPEIGWSVGKLLSTTSIAIRDYETDEIYWSVYRNYQPEARALELLAQHNNCWGDWTLSMPTESTASA